MYILLKNIIKQITNNIFNINDFNYKYIKLLIYDKNNKYDLSYNISFNCLINDKKDFDIIEDIIKCKDEEYITKEKENIPYIIKNNNIISLYNIIFRMIYYYIENNNPELINIFIDILKKNICYYNNDLKNKLEIIYFYENIIQDIINLNLNILIIIQLKNINDDIIVNYFIFCGKEFNDNEKNFYDYLDIILQEFIIFNDLKEKKKKLKLIETPSIILPYKNILYNNLIYLNDIFYFFKFKK